MNPAAVIAIIIVLALFYYGFLGSEGSFFGGGQGPIATGPGSSTIQNPQPVSSGGGSSGYGGNGASLSPTPKPKPGESPYKGTVRISTVERSSDRPWEEYIVIRRDGYSFFGSDRSKTEKPIDVTGWTISTMRESEPIPRAFNIPEIDAGEQDIFLPPGGEVIILSGVAAYTTNFRENKCVGYFNETYRLTPYLSNSCVDSEIDRGALLRKGFNGQCVDTIDSLPSCRRSIGPLPAGIIGAACIDYINENFNYVGCVKNFRDDKDFLKPTWRVSLRRPRKFFNSRHDRVILRDQNGLLVDEFEY